MRILCTIPHYARQAGDVSYSERKHGSLDGGRSLRIEALTACLTALHQLFQPLRCNIDHGQRIAKSAGAALPHQVDVVICTTRGRHLLDQLGVEGRYYEHRATESAPELLGFACHDVLRERLGHYDYY